MIKLLLFCVTFATFVTSEDEFCDSNWNWNRFGDKKCIKEMTTDRISNFNEAENICRNKDSSLLSIHSRHEQELLEEFLFNIRKLVENIWIGLKKRNGFEWTDKTRFNFTNWANGSPHNRSNENCVQISTDYEMKGKWVDVSCDRHGSVVCSKSIQVINLKKIIEELKANLIKRFYQNYQNFLISETVLDDINEPKFFITPLNMSGYRDNRYFSDAANLCANYNLSLIEIKSERKQRIIENVIKDFGMNSVNQMWMNAKKLNGNMVWFKNNSISSYRNWYSGDRQKCDSNSDWNYAIIRGNDGKWSCSNTNDRLSFICESNLN